MPSVPPASGREPQPLLDAVLTPSRSLSPAGFRVLMGVVGFLCLGGGAAFAAMGAWPVFGFLGLDVLLVWTAFRASYRSGRLRETIRLDRDALRVSRTGPDGRTRSWSFQPSWLRVDLDEPVGHESQIRLSSHGRTLVVGSFLAPGERAGLARAIRAGIARWRASEAAPA